MNTLTESKSFTSYNEKYQKYLPTVPIELSRNFQKKRIDHRHHSMDALVIACTTRDHVNLINNKHANSKERFDLNRKLRKFERVNYTDAQTGQKKEKNVPTDFLKPWDSFAVDAKNKLETVVVSIRISLQVRLIIKIIPLVMLLLVAIKVLCIHWVREVLEVYMGGICLTRMSALN